MYLLYRVSAQIVRGGFAGVIVAMTPGACVSRSLFGLELSTDKDESLA